MPDTLNPNRVKLVSPLTPAECVARLTAAVDLERAFSPGAAWFGSKPVIGRVTETSLRLRKRTGYRNSFQNYLTATMRAEAGGTSISGHVGMNPFVRAFMFVWFGFLVLFGGAIFISSIASAFGVSHARHKNEWMGIAFFPIMLVFGFLLVRFGRYLARNEERFLTEFLIRALDAREDREGVNMTSSKTA
jgi:hypothetical protein